MKVAVGLIILTYLPAMGGQVAILQRRGEFNHEKMGPESFPGACQVTVHGGAQNETDPKFILMREAHEELGDKATAMIHADLLVEVERVEKPEKDKRIFTYACEVPPYFLSQIVLNPSSGGLRLLPREQIGEIVDLKNFDKVEGVPSRKVTAMFDDEIRAVKAAFEKIQARSTE